MRLPLTHFRASTALSAGLVAMSGCTDPADKYVVISRANSNGSFDTQAVRVGDCNWVIDGPLILAEPVSRNRLKWTIPDPDDAKIVAAYLKAKTLR